MNLHATNIRLHTHWDHRKNEDLLKELNISPILDHINQYQNTWRQYVKQCPNPESQQRFRIVNQMYTNMCFCCFRLDYLISLKHF